MITNNTKMAILVFYSAVFSPGFSYLVVPTLLTLRGLCLFFKIFPISNTGDSIAYILATVHFLHPKHGFFSPTWSIYFHQLAYRDSKVSKRFMGLNQMLCSPSFDWNCGKQNYGSVLGPHHLSFRFHFF